MMLVKLKDTDIWVTPGFYQDSVQFIKKGLHDIAATYGIKISNPELKGLFSMRRETKVSTKMLIRNIYHCNYLSGDVHFPENQSFEIGEIKWLSMKDAYSVLSFESIRMFVKQTDNHPNVVWGGSVIGTKDAYNKWEYEVVEDYYPLFEEERRKWWMRK